MATFGELSSGTSTTLGTNANKYGTWWVNSDPGSVTSISAWLRTNTTSTRYGAAALYQYTPGSKLVVGMTGSVSIGSATALSIYQFDYATPIAFPAGSYIISFKGGTSITHGDTIDAAYTDRSASAGDAFLDPFATSWAGGSGDFTQDLISSFYLTYTPNTTPVDYSGVFADVISPADLKFISPNFRRSETITLNEFRANGFGLKKSDIITPVEGFARLVVYNRNPTDNITPTDIRSMAIVFPKNETLTIVDGGHSRTISMGKVDNITPTENFARIVIYNRNPTDNISMSELISKSVVFYRTDNISLNDVFSIARQFQTSDTIIFTERLAQSYSTLKSDKITLADIKAISLGKSITDTLSLSEVLAKLYGTNYSDNISLQDTLRKSIGILKTDNIVITNGGITKQEGKGILDNLNISERLLKEYSMSHSDALTLAEQLATSIEKYITDNQSILDSFNSTYTPDPGNAEYFATVRRRILLKIQEERLNIKR